MPLKKPEEKSARGSDENRTREELLKEVRELREQYAAATQYIRRKVNQLLVVMGTAPLRPEELDDVTLLELDPISIVSDSFAQVLGHLKDTNEDLRIAHDEIAAIFNSAGMGILVIDRDMRVLAYNSKAEEQFHAAPGMTGKLFCHQLICRQDQPEPCCPARIALETGMSSQRDRVLAGRHYTSVATPIKDKDEAISRIVLVYLDITERILAQENLRESEERYRDLFENSTDLIHIVGADGTIKFVNRAWLKALGYLEQDLTDMSIFDIVHPDCKECGPEFKSVVCGRKDGRLETSFITKDKREIIVEGDVTVITENGNFTGTRGIFRDITERKKLEAQLQQAQKMESIGTLAGGIAHDFNNILTAIIGYGNIVLMKMAKDDPQRKNIEHILASGDRAARLTRDLLLFSRKQISETKPVDLNDIIKKIENFLTRVIGEDVECKTTLSPDSMMILGDAHQLEQVLMNLATNARDAMSQGGVFTVSTEQVRFNDEYIAAHGFGKLGKYALMTISDAGMGMDAATKKHIFEPFFTTKEVGKGTGLGLAVVYGIIKQHEGFINVYSEPGQGTTVKIYLPLISDVGEEEQKPVEEPSRGGTETILLAEDDESVRNLTRSLLASKGYQVIIAIDGQDAVHKYRENKDGIKLLLFDIIMPKKSGKEAYDEIRAIHPDIKILFQSGYAPDVVRNKMSLDDTMPVLFKPSSPAEILKRVRALLDQ